MKYFGRICNIQNKYLLIDNLITCMYIDTLMYTETICMFYNFTLCQNIHDNSIENVVLIAVKTPFVLISTI